jgi:hypothetical protein
MSPGLQQAVLQPGHPLPGADQVGRHLLPEQTAANTSNWTVVSNDGFGARRADLFGNTGSNNINLVSGFPT